MGEVLIKVWLKSIKKYVSELLHKQMNAQKESLKNLSGFTQAPANPQKVCDENESIRKKKTMHA